MFRQVTKRILPARVGGASSAPVLRVSRVAIVPSTRCLVTLAAGKKNTFKNVAVAGALLVGTTATGAGMLLAEQQKVDVVKIKEEIAALIDSDNSVGPTFLRLAWHASGTYSKHDKKGGSNGGTIRFSPEINHGANAGLSSAIAKLETIKARHPAISYADLFILAGVTAVEEMGGPSVTFRLGRKDASSGAECTSDGRLPDADKGSKPGTIDHMREIFYRMGFNDREMVALIGAHAVGRCYPSRSGYSGPWTRAEWTFSNEYFRELIENTWTIKKWKGPEQYEDPSGDLMMLPSDMALIWDKEFKKYVELYAKDEELWHKDFAKAFQKLTEAGTNFPESSWKKFFSWY